MLHLGTKTHLAKIQEFSKLLIVYERKKTFSI